MAAFDLPASQGLFVSSYGHLARGMQAACPLVQHAGCLLPLSEENRAAYERIVRCIEEYGSEASILKTKSSPSEAWHERIVARFNTARDEEVIDETERFQEEIAREKRKGAISPSPSWRRRATSSVCADTSLRRRLATPLEPGPWEGGGGSGALR